MCVCFPYSGTSRNQAYKQQYQRLQHDTGMKYKKEFFLKTLLSEVMASFASRLKFAQVESMDDNCGEWVECMGVTSGCGEQEAGVASGSGWNLWVWLLGVVVRRYIDFLILLIPTPLVSVLFCSSIPTFCSLKKNFFSFLFQYFL